LKNGDHAGTPEGVNNNNNQPWKEFVVGGTRGGSGSNSTASWSGTIGVRPVCQSGRIRPLNNVENLLALLR